MTFNLLKKVFQDRVRGISDRVAALEKAIVELPARRREKINDDLVQISGQVCT